MELKDRISTIIKENQLKQKEMAALVGVTESYISTLLSGRNRNVSMTVADLIEEKFGYSAQWVLSGEEPKYKQLSKNPSLSDAHRQVILHLEKMSEREIKAVLVFIHSLDEYKKAFGLSDEQMQRI